MGEIAPGAARHEDFGARFPVLFQEQHAPPPLGRVESRHQSSGPRTDDYDIPGRFGRILTCFDERHSPIVRSCRQRHKVAVWGAGWVPLAACPASVGQYTATNLRRARGSRRLRFRFAPRLIHLPDKLAAGKRR